MWRCFSISTRSCGQSLAWAACWLRRWRVWRSRRRNPSLQSQSLTPWLGWKKKRLSSWSEWRRDDRRCALSDLPGSHTADVGVRKAAEGVQPRVTCLRQSVNMCFGAPSVVSVAGIVWRREGVDGLPPTTRRFFLGERDDFPAGKMVSVATGGTDSCLQARGLSRLLWNALVVKPRLCNFLTSTLDIRAAVPRPRAPRMGAAKCTFHVLRSVHVPSDISAT